MRSRLEALIFSVALGVLGLGCAGCSDQDSKEPTTDGAPQSDTRADAAGPDAAGPDGALELDAVLGQTCELQVDRVWENPGDGSSPGFPHDELPESSYTPVSDGSRYSLQFSQDGGRVTVEELNTSGVAFDAGEDRLWYEFSPARLGMGRIIVWLENGSLQAELTEYGSGVPIIGSERGPLICHGGGVNRGL